SQARLNAAAGAAGDQTYRPLYCIYVAIGQKQSTIARIISTLEEAGAMPYTIVVAAPAADSATSQYLAPFAGAAMGEWFMDNGMDALIVYDDLSKHAVAYRQVSLVLKRPSGREAYPGDLAQFRELAAFAQFGSELDAATQAKIDRGKRIIELFNQPQHDPIPVEVQVALLWIVQNGYVDEIRVDRIKDYQTRLTEYLTSSKADLLAKIGREGALSDPLSAELRAAADQFKQIWK